MAVDPPTDPTVLHADHRLADGADRVGEVQLRHRDTLEHVGGLADDDCVDVEDHVIATYLQLLPPRGLAPTAIDTSLRAVRWTVWPTPTTATRSPAISCHLPKRRPCSAASTDHSSRGRRHGVRFTVRDSLCDFTDPREPRRHHHVAVVGVGQTVHRTARKDVSMAGLIREAAQEALDDAGMTWSDIDAVVIGKAPDMFEGVAMPELYLADALGAVGKPMIRVHTAGSVGGSTAIVAAKLISASTRTRAHGCLREAVGEQRHVGPVGPDAVRRTAGRGRRWLLRTADPGVHVPLGCAALHRPPGTVKDHLAALRNPKAHLHIPDIDLKMVEESFLLWDPLRYLDVCPSSDGTMAMVLGSREDHGRLARTGGMGPRHGDAQRADDVHPARETR